jgi:xylulokinase
VDCICPAFPLPVFSDELFASNLCTYDYTVQGMYTTIAFNLTGGNLLKWFRDEFGQAEVAEAARTGANSYDLLLQTMADEPASLLVLPYFTPTGTPYFDAGATGAILGLRLSTKRGEVLRALLEGLAYEMRLNLDILARSGIATNQLLAIGGGAKSRRWLQLKADVLNRPITKVAVAEAASLGAAMLARVALGGEDILAVVKQCVRQEETIEPEPARAACYEERFATYLQLYPTLRNLNRTDQ